MEKKTEILIPKFILEALRECHHHGLIPSIQQPIGGNSHTNWIISFSIFDGKIHTKFEIKITSSYGQFLEYWCHSGYSSNDYFSRPSFEHCIRLAKNQMKV